MNATTTTATATTATLQAISNYAWRADKLRAAAIEVDENTHEVTAYLDEDARREVAASMRAEADKIEAAAEEAEQELERRRKALKPFTGYVA